MRIMQWAGMNIFLGDVVTTRSKVRSSSSHYINEVDTSILYLNYLLFDLIGIKFMIPTY